MSGIKLNRLNFQRFASLTEKLRHSKVSPQSNTLMVNHITGNSISDGERLIGMVASIHAEAPPAQVRASYKVVIGVIEALSASER